MASQRPIGFSYENAPFGWLTTYLGVFGCVAWDGRDQPLAWRGLARHYAILLRLIGSVGYCHRQRQGDATIATARQVQECYPVCERRAVLQCCDSEGPRHE